MKIAFAVILTFCLLTTFSFGQVEKIKENLSACNYSGIKTDLEIDFPNSDQKLKLPIGWTGEFNGEHPGLEAKKKTAEGDIWLVAYNSWNPDTKEGLDSLLRSWHSENIKLTIEGSSFILFYDQERNRYEMLFYVDESIEYENRWTWKLYINRKAIEDCQEYACELKSVIAQFVQAYKVTY